MRDYCPSRHEQEKLKPKKVRQVVQLKKSHSLGRKMALFLSFLLVLAVFTTLIFYLLRQQWLKKRQLAQRLTVLLLEENRPQAIVLLQPEKKTSYVYSFADLSRHDWVNQITDNQDNGSDFTSNLLFSYFFNLFIDQVLVYPQALASEAQLVDLENFLIEQLRGVEGGAAAAWLQQVSVSWEWQDPSPTWSDLAEQLQQTSAAPPPNFNCPLAVINTTKQNGLASRLADLLTQKGISIIRRDNAAEDLTESYLLLNPENSACQSLIANWQIFQPEIEIKEDLAKVQSYRAGAVLFIGQDLAKLNVTLF